MTTACKVLPILKGLVLVLLSVQLYLSLNLHQHDGRRRRNHSHTQNGNVHNHAINGPPTAQPPYSSSSSAALGPAAGVRNPSRIAGAVSPPYNHTFPRWGDEGIDIVALLDAFDTIAAAAATTTTTMGASANTPNNPLFNSRLLQIVDSKFSPFAMIPHVLQRNGLFVSVSIRNRTPKKQIRHRIFPSHLLLHRAWEILIQNEQEMEQRRNNQTTPEEGRSGSTRVPQRFHTRWWHLRNAVFNGGSGVPFLVWHGDFKSCNFNNSLHSQNHNKTFSLPYFTTCAHIDCTHAFPFPTYETIGLSPNQASDWNRWFARFNAKYPWNLQKRQLVWRGSLSGPVRNRTSARSRIVTFALQHSNHPLLDIGLHRIPYRHYKRAQQQRQHRLDRRNNNHNNHNNRNNNNHKPQQPTQQLQPDPNGNTSSETTPQPTDDGSDNDKDDDNEANERDNNENQGDGGASSNANANSTDSGHSFNTTTASSSLSSSPFSPEYAWATSALKPPIPLEDFATYRAVLDTDGNSWSSRFGRLLCQNSVVLKVEPHYVDSFYRTLMPWEHYIPIQYDLSDLLETTEWVLHPTNDATVRAIVERAHDWCRENMVRDALAMETLDSLEYYVAMLNRHSVDWHYVWRRRRARLFSHLPKLYDMRNVTGEKCRDARRGACYVP